MATVPAVPSGVAPILASINTATPKGVPANLVTAQAIATQTVVTPLLNKLTPLVSQAAALKLKIITNTASAADTTEYATVCASIAATSLQLQAAGQMDATTLALTQQTLQQTKLKRLTATPGTLSYPQFTDMLTYAFNTQALNPYSRERTCDLEFYDVLSNVSLDIGNHTTFLTSLAAFAQQVLTG